MRQATLRSGTRRPGAGAPGDVDVEGDGVVRTDVGTMLRPDWEDSPHEKLVNGLAQTRSLRNAMPWLVAIGVLIVAVIAAAAAILT